MRKLAKDKEQLYLLIAFAQSTFLVIYCGLIGYLIWRGNEIFGPMTNFFGPMLFLALFVASVVICALIVFGYPAILFWDKKKAKDAVIIVSYTAMWMFVYILLFMLFFIFF